MGIRRALRKRRNGRENAEAAKADSWFPSAETSAEERLNEVADELDILREAEAMGWAKDGR